MIKGINVNLRACEPTDIDLLYHWENDISVWHVTNTYIPFSKHTLSKYLDSIQDIYTDKQLRLMIMADKVPVGMLDLFDYEPYHARAGVGILIASEYRNRGYAKSALELLKTYCKNQLGIRLLYCNILENNYASIALFEGCGFDKQGQKMNWHRTDNHTYSTEFYFQLELG